MYLCGLLRNCTTKVSDLSGNPYQPISSKPNDYLCEGFETELNQLKVAEGDGLAELNLKVGILDQKIALIEELKRNCKATLLGFGPQHEL